MTDKLILHKSTVLMYEKCPYRYFLSQVRKIPTKPTIEMAAGTAFHKDARAFFEQIKPLVEGSTIQDLSEKAVYGYMRGYLPSLTVYDFMLDNFAKLETQRYMNYKKERAFGKYMPLMLETFVQSPELRLAGTFDRVDMLPSENLVVIDYKTGKVPKQKTDIRFELCVYVTIINQQKLFENPIEHICAYYPAADEVFFERLKSQTVTAMHRRVQNAREGIEKQYFSKNISMLCDWCEYSKYCLLQEKVE